MRQYLLSVYQPDGDPPSVGDLDRIMREVDEVDREMRAADVHVFTARLHPPNTATVVRVTPGGALMTDGPFVEGREHLGGVTIVRAADLDAALDWGRRLSRATTLPVEVRPFREERPG
jgi:hypothetical protein